MSAEQIAELLVPYVAVGPSEVDWVGISERLAVYLDLILKWNARTNLTAIREPEEIVRRHFGESLFTGLHLGRCATLLDFGSGAGFPGVPIQLLWPEVEVTLAESQGKKAAFLREVVRELGLDSEVWGGRVEAMPVARRFDVVAMRAVDKMGASVREAVGRASERLMVLGTVVTVEGIEAEVLEIGRDFGVNQVGVPMSTHGILWVAQRSVPRGA